LVSDFYAAYNGLDCANQRCLSGSPRFLCTF
jgi:hypothetical protein